MSTMVSIQAAAKATGAAYYQVWHLVDSRRVRAARARRPGGRQMRWLVDVAEVKAALAKDSFEVLEIVSAQTDANANAAGANGPRGS